MSPKLKFPLLMKFDLLLVDLKLHVSSDMSRDVFKLTTVSRDPQCYGSAGPAVKSAKLAELLDHNTLVNLRLWDKLVIR